MDNDVHSYTEFKSTRKFPKYVPKVQSIKREDMNLFTSGLKKEPINVEQFWIYDTGPLFYNFNIIPHQHMTLEERLNAMTRVIIIIAVIMLVVRFPLWWLFLVIGFFFVLILYFFLKHKQNKEDDNIQMEYLRRPRRIITPIYDEKIEHMNIIAR